MNVTIDVRPIERIKGLMLAYIRGNLTKMGTIAINQVIDKSPLKEPCNGCGQCCQVAVCATATWLFVNLKRDNTPCPLLNTNNECGILNRRSITRFSRRQQNLIIKHHKTVISYGKGCGYAGPWEPWDLLWLQKNTQRERRAIDEMTKSFAKNRISQTIYKPD